MFPTTNPTKTDSWKMLLEHFNEIEKDNLKNMFAEDPERFNKMSQTFETILVDYSKNRISDKTLRLLYALAEECGLNDAIKAMFSGEKINFSENRAVLHTALRNQSNTPIMVEG